MFSPILAIVTLMSSAMVWLPVWAALIASMSLPAFKATWAIIFTRPWNMSLRRRRSRSPN